MLAPSWWILYPKFLELSLRSVGFSMSLCPMLTLELSLSGFLTASDQGTLSMFRELFNISTLDPLFPTLLIAALSLCVLLVLAYHSLALAWELFWASQQSPSLLDPSAEVVLTGWTQHLKESKVMTTIDLRLVWEDGHHLLNNLEWSSNVSHRCVRATPHH